MIVDGNDPAQIARAVDLLRAGDVVVMPTETVYGLAADARNCTAVHRIFALKGRPADHPVIVHLGAHDQLDAWARDIPAVARTLIERFWPGPLTLILPAAEAVLAEVTGGQPTIGLRMPDHPVALALLRAFGGGLAAPSANRFGRISPTRAAHVAAEFADAVPLILDGGDCVVGLESTILDLSGVRPRLLRPGVVTPLQLAELLGALPAGTDTAAPRAPGTLAAHYAPVTPLELVDATDLRARISAAQVIGQRVAMLAISSAASADIRHRLPDDPVAYGQALYSSLRTLDASGVDLILVERPPAAPAWQAINDRLTRAARGRADAVDRDVG